MQNTNKPVIDARSLTVPDLPKKGGEGGAISVTNAQFIDVLFPDLATDEHVALCSKPGDPTQGGWSAFKATDNGSQCPATANNYFNCSTYRLTVDGQLAARKDMVAKYRILMCDDIGTKVPLDRLKGITPTYAIETSPGNFHYGFRLTDPITDQKLTERLQKAVTDAGMSDKGAMGAARWARLPVAINGKDKYRDENGRPFQCRLTHWNPQISYTVKELAVLLDLPAQTPASPAFARPTVTGARPETPPVASHVFTPAEPVNPVITALQSRGLYKKDNGSGRHEITCPWVGEHTDAIDSGTAYFEPSDAYPIGGFKCHHSHGDRLNIGDLLKWLNVPTASAKNLPAIMQRPGEIHSMVEAAEFVLAQTGQAYQMGGCLVFLNRDKATGHVKTNLANDSTITLALSKACQFTAPGGKSESDRSIDPPVRLVGALVKALNYEHLPVLTGIARQPFYRPKTHEFVNVRGYDAASGIYGDFAPIHSLSDAPTMADAKAALAAMEGLLSEFRFASPADKAAALAACMTACLRPSLPFAPAFMTTAPDSGVGKSYLSGVITGFLGAEPARVSYPRTNDEATKQTIAALIDNPAAIEYDDMTFDMMPHGAINRMLTSETMADRILGSSKTVTVGTRTLVLASGINIEPLRDLKRRVIPIRLAARDKDGISRKFEGKPAEAVRANLPTFAAHVFTIVGAYRAEGSPKVDCHPLASYDGPWGDMVRRPLIWLGLPDPASGLLEQVASDPEREEWGQILKAWHGKYKNSPVTVRRLVDDLHRDAHNPLNDLIENLPVFDGGKFNPSKLGWKFKKRNGQIIDGLCMVSASADGRPAWAVESR